MAFKTPAETATAAAAAGTTKAALAPAKLLIAGVLAGAYIAFGALFGVSVTAGLDPATWGTLPQLITGAAFSFGLMLVVITGAELVTGGIALTTLAAIKGRVSGGRWTLYLLWTTLGALAGSLFVAYFLGVQSGVLTTGPALERISAIGEFKAHTETDWQIFLRGIGCNWLVCLAVWMALAADDVGGKLMAIFFPVTAFVAMGFDHVVANMFFLPAAQFAGAPIGWDDILRNWAFAGAGNLVGAVAFVACAYWFLFLRGTPAESAAPAQRAAAVANGGAPAPEPVGAS
jgi:formate/nitrite transporter